MQTPPSSGQPPPAPVEKGQRRLRRGLWQSVSPPQNELKGDHQVHYSFWGPYCGTPPSPHTRWWTGRRWGRSTTCEQRDNPARAYQSVFPPPSGDRQCGPFPPQNLNNFAHREVPTGTLTEPLWPSPPQKKTRHCARVVLRGTLPMWGGYVQGRTPAPPPPAPRPTPTGKTSFADEEDTLGIVPEYVDGWWEIHRTCLLAYLERHVGQARKGMSSPNCVYSKVLGMKQEMQQYPPKSGKYFWSPSPPKGPPAHSARVGSHRGVDMETSG